VEAASRNIQVGSHLSGIVAEVFVAEGQQMAKDAVLFTLDNRAASAAWELAKAGVHTATVALADEQDQLKRAENLQVGSSISLEVLQRRRFAVRRAEATLLQAKAQQKAAETTLALHQVLAPLEGRILKVRLRKGEFVAAGTPTAPLVMGQDSPLHLRVALDENDLWRYRPTAKAMAVMRSNKDITFPLTFVGVEPLVLPKKELSGDPTERVDTRVLEVIYSFHPVTVKGAAPVYIGQQMDVFIEGE
jgi:RND family efflux transporter MFP subunit